MFTAEIRVALDQVSEAQLWLKQYKTVKKTLHIAVTRPEVIEYLYVKQIVQQFAKNAYRKNIVQDICLYILMFSSYFRI